MTRSAPLPADVLIDLAGDALCLPHDADICRARRLFTDVPKADVPYAAIRIGPVPLGSEVRLIDDATRLVADEVSDRRHREFLLPWTDGDGFAGNPCIARFATLLRAELGAVRIGLSGQVLHRVARLPGPVKAFAVVPELVVVLDDRGATFLDWQDPDRPQRVGAVQLAEPVGVDAAGSNFVVVTPIRAVIIDAGAGREPTVTARGEIDGGAVFGCSHSTLAVVRTDMLMLYTFDDGRIRRTRELQLPVGPEHIAFSGRRVVISGGSEVVLLRADGDVDARWTAAMGIDGLVASGRSIWVRAGGTDTKLELAGDQLMPVSSVISAGPALAFSPGPMPEAFFADPTTISNCGQLFAINSAAIASGRPSRSAI